MKKIILLAVVLICSFSCKEKVNELLKKHFMIGILLFIFALSLSLAWLWAGGIDYMKKNQLEVNDAQIDSNWQNFIKENFKSSSNWEKILKNRGLILQQRSTYIPS